MEATDDHPGARVGRRGARPARAAALGKGRAATVRSRPGYPSNESPRVSLCTSDLYDRFEDRLRVLPPVFNDYGQRRRFRGEAVTVKCFEDNSKVKELAGTPGRGKVMVVDGGGSTRCALLGDLIGADAVKNGWEGVVIHGCVRDSAALAELDLGVKAIGTTPRKSLRRGEGQTALAIAIGGVTVRPGDVVVADEDGVVVLEAAQAQELGG